MEDYIDRPRYIDRIRPFVDVPVIKILTGVRRCGKSTLLDMIAERISERFPRAPVVRLNLESEAGLALRDPAALLEHLRARLPDRSQRAYVFLDEVQRVPGWEDAVNALRVDWNCDLYLTGSNSTMLAGELATNLAGRYVEFPVLPLAFREFIELHAGTARAPRELFDDYLVLGGFPALKYFGLERSPSIQYLQSVLDTVIVRDVIEHHQVRDVDLFRRLIRYCIGNIGRTFSARSVVRYLKSEGRAVSVDTVLNYLDFCIGAHIIARVPRRDVAGKSILRSDEKYYASPTSRSSWRTSFTPSCAPGATRSRSGGAASRRWTSSPGGGRRSSTSKSATCSPVRRRWTGNSASWSPSRTTTPSSCSASIRSVAGGAASATSTSSTSSSRTRSEVGAGAGPTAPLARRHPTARSQEAPGRI